MTEYLKMLKSLFLIVRLVDVSTNTEYNLDKDGNIIEKETKCFEVWGKNGRCHNCISSQAYRKKTQLEKFEFIGDQAYRQYGRHHDEEVRRRGSEEAG